MLVRVARQADGAIAIDEKGTGPGRGAYLCRLRTCWFDEAVAKHLGHSLRARLSPADQARLLAFAANLPEEADTDQDGVNSGGHC